MERIRNWLTDWGKGMRNTYRFVIMNDETFEEVGSYRLTRLNVYIMASSIFVVLVVLVTMVITFTSLKRYIPGYGDVNLKDQADQLEKRVDEAEKELAARELYIQTMQKVLTGNLDTSSDTEQEQDFEYDTSHFDFEPIPEDLALRTEMERDEMISIGENANAVMASNDNSLEDLYFATPVKGAVVSDEFQEEKGHLGIDLVGAANAPILATLDGVVMMSDYTFETGYVIGIQHDFNLISFYKHNSKLLKKLGDRVKAGEAIAIIGNTGELTDGPHLHFELWNNGKPVNPRTFIFF